MFSVPRLAITLGDPGGVGPELVFQTIPKLINKATPILFGPLACLDDPYLKSFIKFPIQHIQHPEEITEDHQVYFVPIETSEEGSDNKSKDDYVKARPDAQNGLVSYHAVLEAISWTKNNTCHGIVTAPICKESWQAAGLAHTGHTTLLAEQCQSNNESMAFYSDPLKVILHTVHIPFHKVPSRLTTEALHQTFENAFLYAKTLGIKSPRIGVAGLNPHASENGMFGEEEAQFISPAIQSFNAHDGALTGPHAPDTLFYRAKEGEFDIVVALYHDQGLIPLKYAAFDTAVNVTIGLPIIRTSPDHGTAFDIAYQGKASTTSFESACQLALKLINTHAT